MCTIHTLHYTSKKYAECVINKNLPVNITFLLASGFLPYIAPGQCSSAGSK